MTTNKVANSVKVLLAEICGQLILKPDRLKIDVMPMTESFVVYILASFSDAKRIVGTGGVHFEALRNLVKLIGQKHGFSGELDTVQDDGKPVVDRYPEFAAADNWPKAKVQTLIQKICAAVFRDDDAIRINIQDGQNGMSMVEVLISGDEADSTVEKMRAILTCLVKPIGKGNQRRLLANIVASGSSERQPASADGRFAKEISRR